MYSMSAVFRHRGGGPEDNGQMVLDVYSRFMPDMNGFPSRLLGDKEKNKHSSLDSCTLFSRWEVVNIPTYPNLVAGQTVC